MDIHAFFEIVTKPEPVMARALKKTNKDEAMKTFAIYGGVIGFLIGLSFAFLGGVVGTIGVASNSPLLGLLGGLGLASIVIMPIVMAIIAVVGAYISTWVLWMIAKFLGGKGTFEQNFYLTSCLVWPVVVLSVVANALLIIPLLGGLIYLAWNLYAIYLYVVLVSIANKLSKGKAFLAWLIMIVIFGALAFFLAGSLALGVLGAFSGY